MDMSDHIHVVTEDADSLKVSDVPEDAFVKDSPTPQALAQGIRGEIPLLWDMLQESFSEWLMGAGARQKEVTRSLIPPPNLPKLLALHLNREGLSDPCSIEAYRFEHPQRDAAYIKDMETKATHEIQVDVSQAAAIKQTIHKLVEQVMLLDVPAIEDRLARGRSAELERLLQASQRVGEIFSRDPKERKGRQDVLLAECGPTRVEGMTEAQKNDVYKDVRNQRTLARLRGACSSAKALCNIEEMHKKVVPSLELRDRLVAQEARLDHFKARKLEANVVKTEVEDVIRVLRDAILRGSDQLTNCREKKEGIARVLEEKKFKLQLHLAQLHQVEDEYMNLYIEDEAHRISCDNLEADLLTTRHRLEMAGIAAVTASEACAKWDEKAREHEVSLLTQLQSEVAGATDRPVPVAMTAGLNAYISIEILQCCTAEKNTEIAAVMLREDDNAEKVQELKAKLAEPDEESDVVEIEVEIARRSDEAKANMRDIEACRAFVAELNGSLQLARESYTFLCKNTSFGEQIGKTDFRAEAQKFVGRSYIEHPQFGKAKPRFFLLPREDQEAELPEPAKTEGAFEWVDAPELKPKFPPPALEGAPHANGGPADAPVVASDGERWLLPQSEEEAAKVGGKNKMYSVSSEFKGPAGAAAVTYAD